MGARGAGGRGWSMKAVVFHGIGDIALDDVPEPAIEAETDAVVRLTASELALYIEGCTLVGKHALSPIAIERKRLVSDRAM